MRQETVNGERETETNHLTLGEFFAKCEKLKWVKLFALLTVGDRKSSTQSTEN